MTLRDISAGQIKCMDFMKKQGIVLPAAMLCELFNIIMMSKMSSREMIKCVLR